MEQDKLPIEFLSVNAFNAFSAHNSASRGVMLASHLSQRLVIEGCEEKLVQTGAEREFGKYTFTVTMPEDGLILQVIPRYPFTIGKDAIKQNPETLVIYENVNTKEIDCFIVPWYESYHQYLGFKYEYENLNYLIPGTVIPKGTLFARPRSVNNNYGYKFGINLNTVFMSVPGTSEDGIVICEDVLPRLKFKIYETRVVEFGSKSFPLNLYGSLEEYKPFPDIGDKIRDDGILMMLREYDFDNIPAEMSLADTMKPDFKFDKATYARGPGGTVIDVKVISNNLQYKQLPEGMSAQAEKYKNALYTYHKTIIDEINKIRYDRKRKFGDGNLKLSPRLHHLVVDCYSKTDYNPTKLKQKLNLLYRRTPLDEYRVEFVVEYDVTPSIGYKLSDVSGGKGVICKILKPEEMPVDANGVRADIILSSDSVVSRMNLGRVYEHYFNGALMVVTKEVRSILGLKQGEGIKVEYLDEAVIKNAFDRLLFFYSLTSYPQYEEYKDLSMEDIKHILTTVVDECAKLFYPPNVQRKITEVIHDLEKHFKQTYGPVTYIGNSGRKVKTKRNIRIAPLYIILLEKIGDDWSSVSTAKYHPMGMLSLMTKTEKFAHPYRNTPVRTIGETEGRLFSCYCPRWVIAEMMDRSNNPWTQRNIAYNILSSPTPGNINLSVNRNFIPLGGSKTISNVQHIFNCTGIKFVYKPEYERDVTWPY